MLYFKMTSRNGKLGKRLFLGHLQPLVDKTSVDIAILIIEFDDNLGIVVKREAYYV